MRLVLWTTVLVSLACAVRCAAYPIAYTIASSTATSNIDGAFGTATFGGNADMLRNLDGSVIITSDSSHIMRVVANQSVRTVAGTNNTPGFANGAPLSARFNSLRAFTRISSGYVVADRSCLRLVPSDFASAVSTYVGSDCASTATVEYYDVAVSLTGALFALDGKNKLLLKVTAGNTTQVVANFSSSGVAVAHAAIVNDTFALVAGSTSVFHVNLQNGATVRKDFTTQLNAQPFTKVHLSYEPKSRKLFAATTTISFDWLFTSYHADSGNFTTEATTTTGSTDGSVSPSFKNVAALHALSAYELLVLEDKALRGIKLSQAPAPTKTPFPTSTKTRPSTKTQLITATKTKGDTASRSQRDTRTRSIMPTATATVTASMTASPSRTPALSQSLTVYGNVSIFIHFLSQGFPLNNASAMEAIRKLMTSDANDCATPFSVFYVTVLHNVSNTVIRANITLSSLVDSAARNRIAVCAWTRTRNFLNTISGRICVSDVSGDSYECRPAGTTERCDAACIVAITMSIGIVVAVSLLAMLLCSFSQSGRRGIKSALLLFPGPL